MICTPVNCGKTIHEFKKTLNIDLILKEKYKVLMELPINPNIIGLYVKVGKNMESCTYGKIMGFDKYNRCIIDISSDIFEEHFIKLPVFWGNLEDISGKKLSEIFQSLN